MSFHHCCCHSQSSVCTSFWKVVDKNLKRPSQRTPLLPFSPLPSVPVTLHYSETTGGAPGLTSTRFSHLLSQPIRSHSPGAAEQTCQCPRCRFLHQSSILGNCSIALHILSWSNFPFYFLYDHWITDRDRVTYGSHPRYLEEQVLFWCVWAGALGKPIAQGHLETNGGS